MAMMMTVTIVTFVLMIVKGLVPTGCNYQERSYGDDDDNDGDDFNEDNYDNDDNCPPAVLSKYQELPHGLAAKHCLQLPQLPEFKFRYLDREFKYKLTTSSQLVLNTSKSTHAKVVHNSLFTWRAHWVMKKFRMKNCWQDSSVSWPQT